MIINTSYFIYKPVFIPGAIAEPDAGFNTPTNVQALQQFIDEKEYTFLLNALGHEQTVELLSQFTSEGNWIENPIQKWVDLVDGLDEWRGLRYEIGTSKVSLIAYYVYFYFLQDDWKTYTTTGIQVPDAANSTPAVPFDKQAKAWNTFVKMYNDNYFGYSNPTFFNNWNGYGMMWAGYGASNEVYLYRYLQKRSDVYDTSKFKRLSIINPNGL